jgi:DNA-directed RNA polymerase alpha subunit
MKNGLQVRTTNNLARMGLTLEDARRMTDAELLAIPNFGKGCLKFARSIGEAILTDRNEPTNKLHCPHCGGLLEAVLRPL